jgi:hypothetical protein
MIASFLRRPRRSPGWTRFHAAAAFVLLAAGLAAVGAAPQTPAPAPGPIAATVDVGKAGAKIDRDLFGQFAEHLGKGVYEGVWVGAGSPVPNTRGIRNDVVGALKALKVPNVRWPGGCFADEYHWRKGVGPAGARPVTLNPNWGGVTEPNTFGTHEFMDFVDQIGSEAYLSINVGSGTPRQGARRQRAPGPLQDRLPGHRQRELGLRRQHVCRVLPEPAPRLQPLRAELQPRSAQR